MNWQLTGLISFITAGMIEFLIVSLICTAMVGYTNRGLMFAAGTVLPGAVLTAAAAWVQWILPWEYIYLWSTIPFFVAMYFITFQVGRLSYAIVYHVPFKYVLPMRKIPDK